MVSALHVNAARRGPQAATPVQRDVKQLNARIEELQAQLATEVERNTAYQDGAIRIRGNLEEQEAQILRLKQQAEVLNQRDALQEAKIALQKSKIIRLNRKADELLAQTEEQGKKYTELFAQIVAQEKRRAELEAKQSEYLAGLEQNNAQLKTNLEERTTEIEKLKKDIEDRDGKITALTHELNEQAQD